MEPHALPLRRIITNLKPSGVTVFFAMLFLGGTNITQKKLMFATALTDKTVSAALTILHAEGLAIPTRTGWCLTDASRQLELPVLWYSRRISDSSSSINTESLNNSESTTTKQDSENFRLRLAALITEGVIEPWRSELAAVAHLTPAHIQNWAKIKKTEVGETYSPRLLNYILRNIQPGEPPPPDPEACKCGLMPYHQPGYGQICPGCLDFVSACRCSPGKQDHHPHCECPQCEPEELPS